ncbi:hypothetical protein HYQ45_010129 [Verticillium longisporum]|uniref:Uncharacterized protein n=1 Tax=Verticillium longisporum TaxID=100787 RepID=A0A8I2ZGW3_VERLO|nr:hypothetical protein HYQ45_010129 [Verticillium longisporum]
MMAARRPLQSNPLIPVTPPPEQTSFQQPHIASSNAHLKRKAPPEIQALLNDVKTTAPRSSSIPTPARTETPPSTMASQHGSTKPNAGAATATLLNPVSGQPMDPRYIDMVSRIAAYYQQRCQAISNAQQQRCQAWANMHRQKCQDTMQAAMLVVAWYVRDRIQRRRRRQKRSFRAGLRARESRSRVTKGERVRRWVTQVPENVVAPQEQSRDDLADQEEASFSIDRELVSGQDAKLFETADRLIRSQYRKVDVPMLGLMSFDMSDSDSDSDGDADDRVRRRAPSFEEIEDDDEELDYDDDEYEDEELPENDDVVDGSGQGSGSQDVQHDTTAATGGGSGTNGRSSSSS